jgi:hypothetical protein
MNAQVDETGFLMLVECVPAVGQGSCSRNQLREGVQRVRKESILSIACAARRTGQITVVVGQENHRVRCEHDALTNEFRWWWDDWPAPSHKISFLLDDAQGVDRE